MLSLSRLVLVNKMQRELNHLFSGSCNRVVTDIPQNLTLIALLRNLLGLGNIYIYNDFADSQHKTKQHWEYCNDFNEHFMRHLSYYNPSRAILLCLMTWKTCFNRISDLNLTSKIEFDMLHSLLISSNSFNESIQNGFSN